MKWKRDTQTLLLHAKWPQARNYCVRPLASCSARRRSSSPFPATVPRGPIPAATSCPPGQHAVKIRSGALSARRLPEEVGRSSAGPPSAANRPGLWRASSRRPTLGHASNHHLSLSLLLLLPLLLLLRVRRAKVTSRPTISRASSPRCCPSASSSPTAHHFLPLKESIWSRASASCPRPPHRCSSARERSLGPARLPARRRLSPCVPLRVQMHRIWSNAQAEARPLTRRGQFRSICASWVACKTLGPAVMLLL